MIIRFDEHYVFCSKRLPRMYLYKVSREADSSRYGFIMGSGLKWKKVTLEQFNKMGLALVGKYKAGDGK